ncbi:MAG TPA: Zn-dependent hydrolase [Chloroflexi bacterium]|nr:Zn-dependent hydrolase [Chloroflexota bacterium]
MLTNIHWLGHDSFKISGERVIYIDPWQLENPERADIVLVTHEHRDHLSRPDIEQISDEHTTVVATAACAAQLERIVNVVIVAPGDNSTVQGVPIEVIPAYNVNKYRSEGVHFHPKEAGGVGYIVTVGGKRIYHAGDSDLTPEMMKVDADIVLLPVSGRAVMTAEEAADAVRSIRPEVAIPMHYGSIMGSIDDAIRFKQLSPVPVEILEKSN